MRFDYGYDEEQRLGKAYDWGLFRRILPYAAPHRFKLALSMMLVVALTLLELSVPLITKEIIDRYILPTGRIGESADKAGGQVLLVDPEDPDAAAVIARYPRWFRIHPDHAEIRLEDMAKLDRSSLGRLRQKDLAGLGLTSALFLGVIIAIFVFTFLQRMVMEIAGNLIMHDLRMGLYGHIQNMPLRFFTKNPVARLVTRVTNDIQNMHELFTSFFSMLFKDIFLLIGIAVILLVMEWRLALLTFLVLPLVVSVTIVFSRRVRDVFRLLRIQVAEINTRFSETIGGIKVIQAFSRQRQNEETFKGLNHENYLAGMRQINLYAVFMPVVEMLGVTATAIVIWVGGWNVLDQLMSIGVLAAFLAYMRMFFRPIRDMAEKYNILQNAMSSAERIFLLMDTSGAPKPETSAMDSVGPLKEIRFHDVSLAYNEGEPVLRNIDLAINSGETIAIVGATGSGKTSLVNLMVRFYDSTEGRLTVNGMDITRIPPAIVRSRIALVMQDPFLFSGTLASNIFFSANGLGDRERQRILAASCCQELVDRLPDGLETRIGEAGATLSSGERQLVSVARAFSTDPELIILDEATSYVDSATEMHLQKAIGNLTQGRTCIVVAHRLTTARSADRIVVLNNGIIVESGNHETLMDAGGYYHRLYQLQAVSPP